MNRNQLKPMQIGQSVEFMTAPESISQWAYLQRTPVVSLSLRAAEMQTRHVGVLLDASSM